MWFVYILRCKDKSLYTGITTDIRRRIREHHALKGSKAITGRLPAKLIYHESLRTRSQALKREARIKSWPRSRKLEFLKKSRKAFQDLTFKSQVS